MRYRQTTFEFAKYSPLFHIILYLTPRFILLYKHGTLKGGRAGFKRISCAWRNVRLAPVYMQLAERFT